MDKNITVGQKAPDFLLKDQTGKDVSLKDFLGQWLIIYFYPKDNTPGCTTEALDFSQYRQILGVSPDSQKSHCKFIEKHNLSIQLLSDPEHIMAESYGVWGLKKFMGKEYMGIIRSTFLVNPRGTIADIWQNVKVKNHSETVWNTFIDSKDQASS
ncbi:MAG: hypothetical protein RLZZ148_1268 [Cyanobacteriota bacterium]